MAEPTRVRVLAPRGNARINHPNKRRGILRRYKARDRQRERPRESLNQRTKESCGSSGASRPEGANFSTTTSPDDFGTSDQLLTPRRSGEIGINSRLKI